MKLLFSSLSLCLIAIVCIGCGGIEREIRDQKVNECISYGFQKDYCKCIMDIAYKTLETTGDQYYKILSKPMPSPNSYEFNEYQRARAYINATYNLLMGKNIPACR